jgi:Rrf2 family protein
MITQTAEYALRAMAVLAAEPQRLIPTNEIAELGDVPPPYLAKVLQQLAGAGLIRGRRGVGGGYTLRRVPDDITLFDVIMAVSSLRTPRGTADLAALGDGLAELHRAIDAAAAASLRVMQDTTVAEITQDRARVAPRAPAAQPAPDHVA